MSDDQLPCVADVRLRFPALKYKKVEEDILKDLTMPMAFVDAKTVRQWERTKSAIVKNAKRGGDCE